MSCTILRFSVFDEIYLSLNEEINQLRVTQDCKDFNPVHLSPVFTSSPAPPTQAELIRETAEKEQERVAALRLRLGRFLAIAELTPPKIPAAPANEMTACISELSRLVKIMSETLVKLSCHQSLNPSVD